MFAQIRGLKEWKDGSGYPVLTIEFLHPDNPPKKNIEQLEALELIEKSVSDIVGKAYGAKIASTQKGSGQPGVFVVDLSAVLTMLKAVKESETQKSAANQWVVNWLKDKVKPEWLPSFKKHIEKQEVYTCRCGAEFKSKKGTKKAKRKWARHQKRCTVLGELEKGLFKRSKQLLDRLEKEDGKAPKESTHKTKARKTEGHRSGKSSKGSKGVGSGAKTRRSKRDRNSPCKR